jgi:hypothetical protein
MTYWYGSINEFPPGQYTLGQSYFHSGGISLILFCKLLCPIIYFHPQTLGIDDVLKHLGAGDRLIVSELSRLGRSLGQIIHIVDTLVKRNIRFVAIKETIRFEGKQTMQTKVMVALFGLFAEVERNLISERTREGLIAAKAKGKLLGRPRGSLGRSKLGGKELEIQTLLDKKVSKASIAKIMGPLEPPFTISSAREALINT